MVATVSGGLLLSVVAAAPAKAEAEEETRHSDAFIRTLDAQQLWQQGSPRLRNWARNLPQSAGVQAQPDLFAAPLLPGTASINLSGLGAEHTSVSLNGIPLHRTALPSAGGGGLFVNINQVPTIALQQLQIGSDSQLGGGRLGNSLENRLGGGLELRSRDDFLGTEFAYSHSFVEHSDDDRRLSILWGTQRQSARADTHLLLAASGDTGSDLESRRLGWENRNADPAFAVTASEDDCGSIGAVFADNSCRLRLGSTIRPAEEEEHANLLLQIRHNEKRRRGARTFRITLLAAQDQLGRLLLPHSWPWRLTGDALLLPADNPAVASFMARNNATLAQAQQAARPGRASNAAGPQPRGSRGHSEQLFDFSMGFGSHRQHNLSFYSAISDAQIRDPLVDTDRYDLALRGFGGAECDLLTGTAGEGGCHYYNPFAYASGDNPRELTAWLVGQNEDRYKHRAEAMSFSFSGDIKQKATDAATDSIVWNWGYRYRQTHWKHSRGTLHGGALATGQHTTHSLFADWHLPLKGGLTLDAGGRLTLNHTIKLQTFAEARQPGRPYDDYGNEMHPHLNLQWQSASADAPPVLSARLRWMSYRDFTPINQQIGVYQQPVFNDDGQYESRRIEGDFRVQGAEGVRTDLGLRIRQNRWTLDLDWWQVDLDNPVTYDHPEAMFMPPRNEGAQGGAAVYRFYNTGPATISGTNLAARWRFDLSAGYSLTLGAEIATVSTYDISVRADNGMVVYDALGRLNTGNWAQPIAERRQQVFLDFEASRHHLRVSLFGDSGYRTDDGASVDSWDTLDAHYIYRYKDGKTRLSLSAINLQDSEPPLVPTELGYNAYNHSNRGSYIRIGFRHQY